MLEDFEEDSKKPKEKLQNNIGCTKSENGLLENGIYVVDNYLEIFKGFLTKYTRINLNEREESNPS